MKKKILAAVILFFTIVRVFCADIDLAADALENIDRMPEGFS